jgi:hypothetical protein
MLLTVGLPVALSQGAPNPGAEGEVEISFVFGAAEGVAPSFQTAVWLEDEQGKYVKSLFVSEYLAYGGFNDPTICPAWTKVANWAQASEADYDAVSRPTPPIGSHTLRVSCREKGVPAGAYQYCIQVHIIEGYNILYRGKIQIGGSDVEDVPTPSYVPDKHPSADSVVSSVKVRYTSSVRAS